MMYICSPLPSLHSYEMHSHAYVQLHSLGSRAVVREGDGAGDSRGTATTITFEEVAKI